MTAKHRVAAIFLLVAICLPAPAEEEVDYYAVYMEGKKIGHAIHTRLVEGDKVTTREDVKVTISRLGIPVTMEMSESSVETTDGKPLGFESVQLLGALTMKVAGEVDEQGLVNITSTSLGMGEKSTMRWPEGAVMAEGLRLLTAERGLKSGTEYTVKVFTPSYMTAIEAQVQVGQKTQIDLLGRIVAATEMTTTLTMPGAGRITSVSYVDDELKTLKDVVPLAGFTMEMVACQKEFALAANDVVEFIDRMFIDSPEPLGDLASVRSITYELKLVGTDDLVIPTTDNQRTERLADGTVRLKIAPVPLEAGATFPYAGDDPNLLEAIEPTRYLQSNRDDVVQTAKEAVGDASETSEAVRRIEAFVAQYITNKSLSVGYASAAEVLASRQGDCSEFAVLTAALCRAVGIPSKVVVGVAYVSDFAGHEGFGGHAWTAAYVAGKWVNIDAAFKSGGRGGYDAGHITLAVGDGEPADFFNIAAALGRFRIESVEIEPTP